MCHNHGFNGAVNLNYCGYALSISDVEQCIKLVNSNPGCLRDTNFYPVKNWPPAQTTARIGQPSGVAIDIHGYPMVFHRGELLNYTFDDVNYTFDDGHFVCNIIDSTAIYLSC